MNRAKDAVINANRKDNHRHPRRILRYPQKDALYARRILHDEICNKNVLQEITLRKLLRACEQETTVRALRFSERRISYKLFLRHVERR